MTGYGLFSCVAIFIVLRIRIASPQIRKWEPSCRRLKFGLGMNNQYTHIPELDALLQRKTGSDYCLEVLSMN